MFRLKRRQGLQRLGPGDRVAVQRFLARTPAENGYLLCQVERGALIHDEVAGPIYGFWRADTLEGVACCGTNLVVSEPMSAASVEALSERLDALGWPCRVAVGPDRHISRLMEFPSRQRPPARLDRAGQTLFRVTRDGLIEGARCARLVKGHPRMLDAIVAVDRAMVTEELGYDPFVRDLEAYRLGWLRRLREGRSWVVLSEDDDILFKVDQSAVGDRVVQLAGVYTMPGARRQGLALAGVGEMAYRLLGVVPEVTLYVHTENTPAMGLYGALGFKAVGEVRSVWFDER